MVNFDVVTFGSAVVDIFLETGLAERKGFMAYPVGSKILLKGMRFDIGGGGTNTAVAFSRFGLKTGYVGKLDSGFGGGRILEMLKREKVEFLGKIEKDAKIIGGYSAILDSKEDDRTILTYKGVNNDVKLSDVKKFKAKWIYLATTLGETFKTQEKIVKIFKKKGAKIAFNTTEYQIKELNLKLLLKLCDILILNHEEAQMLVRKRIEGRKLLEALRDLGPRIVVVTNKDKKTFAFDGEEIHSIIPHKIKVVERTGAGDAFASGFVAGQIAGKTIQESLKLGLEESEAVIRYFGAKNNLIRRKLK